MIQRVRGTRDFTPAEMGGRRQVEDLLRSIAREYGYREIQTPVIENAELFIAKSGPAVLEEMYSFEDRGGRQLALRPELTAPVVRFYLSDMSNYPMPLKLWCVSNCFRYEEPQAGRYREFFQFDVEIIGSGAPEADAELLMLASDLCRRLGLKEVSFRIGHVGIVREMLDAAHVPREEQSGFLHLIDKRRYGDAENFLAGRRIDADAARGILQTCAKHGDSSILNGMRGASVDYLREVVSLAESQGTGRLNIDLGVVRGLDYYTGVVFEIDAPELGAEKQICGGGSYSLAPLFGGKEIASTGMAFGFDRLILAMQRAGTLRGEEPLDLFVLAASETLRPDAIRIAGSARGKGITAEFDLMRRSMSKALKYASTRGARFTVIVGEKEKASESVVLRDMVTGGQDIIPVRVVTDEIAQRLRAGRG